MYGILDGLWMLIVGGLLAAPAYASAPTDIGGAISADNGIFIPVSQEGCVIAFTHPDVHELSGSLEGQMTEVGTLTLDVCTGEGFFSAVAEFTGSVLGSLPGTATLTVHGTVTSFVVIEGGHFVLTDGEGGLAGAHAVGRFDYTVGEGGTYTGRAHFDQRR
jgi:hypothetical protein